jgi:predicted ATP-binding protein involved in virulence
MPNITAIAITGLNGHTNVAFRVKQHCIIVGPNGSGKSTALQIIALALGRQWKPLAAMRFDKLTVSFGTRTLEIDREACSATAQLAGNPTRFGRTYRTLLDLDLVSEFASANLERRTAVERFTSLLNLPLSEVRSAQRFVSLRAEAQESQSRLNLFTEGLDQLGVPPTIYLPTYRRIELELNRVTSRVPEYVRQEVTRSLTEARSSEYFEEILRFGMEDIESKISAFEIQTRDFARNLFNRMMSSYLKEMANSASISVRDLRAFAINEDRIEQVLSRIEEGILSTDEKAQIASIVLEMSKPLSGGTPPFNKKWLAHFFVRLLEVDSTIQERERPITSLVKLLRKYLHPKTVAYDIESYHFSIRDNIKSDKQDPELKLSDLSSGEKQLVALLGLLQLNAKGALNVFVDEPELSLSVPWQSYFLPDVSSTHSCRQVFAVTHSPFIYENSLADCVIDFVKHAERVR